MLERQNAAESRPETRIAESAPTASPRLTQDELSELLSEAIRQSGQAEVRREGTLSLATLDDALAVAREAGIPPEHVLSAARELQQRKLRGARREIVRARRRATFLAWVGIAAVAGLI